MLKILSWLFMLEFLSFLIEMNFFQNNNFLDPLFLRIFIQVLPRVIGVNKVFNKWNDNLFDWQIDSIKSFYVSQPSFIVLDSFQVLWWHMSKVLPSEEGSSFWMTTLHS